VQHIPVPVGAYDVLLPRAAEGILAPAFIGYLPIVDLVLLLLVATIGTGSLVFGRASWANEHGTRIAAPVVLAVGAAIALALVFVLLALWAATEPAPGGRR
jgi:hypothetical protein